MRDRLAHDVMLLSNPQSNQIAGKSKLKDCVTCLQKQNFIKSTSNNDSGELINRVQI